MTPVIASEIPVAQAYLLVNASSSAPSRTPAREASSLEFLRSQVVGLLGISGAALLGRSVALSLTGDRYVVLASAIGAGFVGMGMYSCFYIALFGGTEEVQSRRPERQREEYSSLTQGDVFGALSLMV